MVEEPMPAIEEETMPVIEEETNLSNGQFVLGPPISEGLDRERYIYLNEEDQKDYEQQRESPPEDEYEDDDMPPLTPEAAAQMSPPRTPLFLEHTLSRRSSGAISPVSLYASPPSPRRQPGSPRIITRRSSRSSLRSNTPPASPSQEYRSRVSLDATPIPPSLEFAPPASPRSTHSMRQSEFDTETVAESSSSSPRSNGKTARFSQAIPMNRYDQESTSTHTYTTSHSYASSLSREEMTPSRSTVEGQVDRVLRSTPGVIGLGEGWAGGQQRSEGSGRSWFRRKKSSTSQIEEDPLALWSRDPEESGGPSTTHSPLKDMWNRSKRNLFSRSSTALNDTTSQPPSKARGFFSKSLVNLTTSNPSNDTFSTRLDNESETNRRSLAQRFNLSSTSETMLNTVQPNKTSMPPSPSLPLLLAAPLTIPEYKQQPQQSRVVRQWNDNAAFSRSETNLFSIENEIPCRSSSLQRRSQGLRPPWRPQSLLIAGRPHTPLIREVDEEPSPTQAQRTESSISLETPTTSETSHPEEQADSQPTHPLVRTATFGIDDAATELRIDDEEPVPGLDTIEAWARGKEALDKPLHRVPSPQRRANGEKKRSSLLGRMMTVFTSSLSRGSSIRSTTSSSSGFGREASTTPIRKTSFKRPKRTSATITPRAMTPVMEPLSTPFPSRPSSASGLHPHKSWRKSSFAKRLSKLTELDNENEEDGNEMTQGRVEDSTLAGKFREHRRSTSIHLLSPLKSRKSQSSHVHLDLSTRSPAGSTYSGSVRDLRGMTASLSMPALTKFTTTDLNLHVDLDGAGEGLGLEDILDEERRESIVQQLVTTKGDSGKDPVASSSSQPGGSPRMKRRSMHSYSKSSSEPLSSVIEARSSANTRIRHSSMQLIGSKFESNAPPSPSSMVIPTFDFETTSPDSAIGITTPKTGEISLGGGGSFFNHLSLGEDAFKQGRTEEEKVISFPTPPKRDERRLSAISHPYSSLRISENGGLDTKRTSMTSFLSKISFDESDVVEQKAIRVTSLSELQQRASVLTMNQLGQKGLWSGVQAGSA
ncbi:hypothetical protein CI109_102473 [Kwoniella shandongensis]|uniref:Uncharacterized protein n=1 Tax=Kwoniella shandongensis TaxID=1734106 RepID=A0A5M6C154_9TREE|nr:uncharacterized protein CI109_003208 [Kwoniella shandongensis]KAA5528310.1 hypothetical protein CI109_003208 [Kwoniella shandongensis]